MAAKKKPALLKFCNCVTKVNKALADLSKNTPGTDQAEIDVSILFRPPQLIPIPTIAVRRADPLSKKRKPLPPLYPSYCPFCGVEYPKTS